MIHLAIITFLLASLLMACQAAKDFLSAAEKEVKEVSEGKKVVEVEVKKP